jgi:hypothetical protein
MQCRHGMLLLACLALICLGCRGSSDPSETPTENRAQTRDAQRPGPADQAGPATFQDTREPANAVAVFLEAMRRGDDKKVLEMYTERAREQVGQHLDSFGPKASDTAEFAVGQVTYPDQDKAVAHVASTWTDIDRYGQQYTLNFQWALRREAQGYRVGGVAAYPSPDEPPVLFDFENLEEAIRKAEALREEARQSAAQESVQAQQPKIPADFQRR